MISAKSRTCGTCGTELRPDGTHLSGLRDDMCERMADEAFLRMPPPPWAQSFRSISVADAHPELVPVLQAHPTWTIDEAQAFVAGEGWMLFRAAVEDEQRRAAIRIAGR